jgi:Uma2 family endonuclease
MEEFDTFELPLRKDVVEQRSTVACIETLYVSLAYDRGTKLALYAEFGVPEVWIVDLLGAATEVYGEPAGDAYARKERLTSGLLAPVLAPGVTIDVGSFLK